MIVIRSGEINEFIININGRVTGTNSIISIQFTKDADNTNTTFGTMSSTFSSIDYENNKIEMMIDLTNDSDIDLTNGKYKYFVYQYNNSNELVPHFNGNNHIKQGKIMIID